MNELGVLSATALVYMMVAMWATQPSRGCELAQEPSRRLHLDRQLDLEHLARDAERIRRTARRQAAHSDGSESATPTIEQCESRLAQQIADEHAVPEAYVRDAVSGKRIAPR